MNILITGGAGFIGSHFADLLVQKKNIKKIVVIDNLEDGTLKNLKEALKSKKVKFFKADIRDYKKINKLFRIRRPLQRIGVSRTIHVSVVSIIT